MLTNINNDTIHTKLIFQYIHICSYNVSKIHVNNIKIINSKFIIRTI